MLVTGLRSEDFKKTLSYIEYLRPKLYPAVSYMANYMDCQYEESIYVFLTASNWGFIICGFCGLELHYVMLFVRNCSITMLSYLLSYLKASDLLPCGCLVEQ